MTERGDQDFYTENIIDHHIIKMRGCQPGRYHCVVAIADEVCDDPLTVKLRFEPSGRPKSEANYYCRSKQNICVVCGSKEAYVRKNVVPHEYRK